MSAAAEIVWAESEPGHRTGEAAAATPATCAAFAAAVTALEERFATATIPPLRTALPGVRVVFWSSGEDPVAV